MVENFALLMDVLGNQLDDETNEAIKEEYQDQVELLRAGLKVLDYVDIDDRDFDTFDD